MPKKKGATPDILHYKQQFLILQKTITVLPNVVSHACNKSALIITRKSAYN